MGRLMDVYKSIDLTDIMKLLQGDFSHGLFFLLFLAFSGYSFSVTSIKILRHSEFSLSLFSATIYASFCSTLLPTAL
jgi:hypothetical protein